MEKETIESTKDLHIKNIKILRKLLSYGEIFLMMLPMLFVLITIVTHAFGEAIDLTTEISWLLQIPEEKLNLTLFIISCVGYLINILIINRIGKILENTEKSLTPFTESNVKILGTIKKLSIISFATLFLGSNWGISLIPLIIILALSSVFKYGFILQTESDETL